MTTANPSTNRDPLSTQFDTYAAALKAGDVPTLVSLFCEDAVLMPANETSLYGRAEIAEWWREYFDHFRITALSISERDVNFLGEWAVERRSHMVAIVPEKSGETIRDDGRAVFIWKREADGVWRISQFIFNSIRPIGSGTSRFLARMKTRKNAE
jgi:uncharacterized protein (TIGR02246 family)